jgi:hypothetical protein
VLARYDEELSYRPNFNIGEYRYFMVDTVHVKPGHSEHFGNIRKMINAAHEKAGIDEHMIVYSALAGAPFGTYIVFQPVKSLKEFDGMTKTHGKGSAYQETIGDEGRKKLDEFNLNALNKYERNWVAFSPEMSYMPADVVATAPDFWTPKAMVAKAEHATKTNAVKKEKAK